MRKTLFMETTKISVSQTVGEIQRLLGEYGATGILIEYNNREPSSILFEIKLNGRMPSFELPCRWEEIRKLLDKKHPPESYPWGGRIIQRDNTDQAKRVAWRQILRWVEAQLALVETGMVKIQEVFLPYLQTGRKESLYDLIEKNNFKMIEDKTKKGGV